MKKKKILEGLNQYNESAIFIKNHKLEFIKSIFRVFIQIILFYSITYFVYRAFNLNSSSFFEVFAMQAILYTTVSSLPLPGSIGVSETLFLKIFTSVFASNILASAMLVYRFVSFYLYILVSAIVVVITAVKTKNIVGEVDKNIIEIEKDDKKLLLKERISY